MSYSNFNDWVMLHLCIDGLEEDCGISSANALEICSLY